MTKSFLLWLIFSFTGLSSFRDLLVLLSTGIYRAITAKGFFAVIGEDHSLSKFFWQIMEGKRWVKIKSNPNINSQYPNHKERYLQRKIQKLQEDLEELKQQKAELLN